MHKPLTREPLPADYVGRLEPVEGLVGSSDWHRDRQVVERGAIPDPENRALLLNSIENRQELASMLPRVPESLDDANMAGENVVLRSNGGESTCDLLCVGDALSVRRGTEVCAQLVVASPRWPCYKFDRRHGQRNSKEAKLEGDSVQVACCCTGLGGVFTSVVGEGGTIMKGDELWLERRPCPNLTLRKVSDLCYGHPKSRVSCFPVVFNGTDAELQELIDCEFLARFEWRDRLVKLQKQMEEKRIEEAKSTRKRATIGGVLVALLVLCGAIFISIK